MSGDELAPVSDNVLRTPDDWCAIKGIEILDHDGWRDGTRPWHERISESEFDRRAAICTMRHVPPAPTQAPRQVHPNHAAAHGHPGEPCPLDGSCYGGATMPTQAPQADETLAGRIAAGRVNHGVGSDEYFPGNVQHLVSPIVGMLRLKERDGADVPVADLAWFIDRLSLVLDLARAEDAHVRTIRAEREGDPVDCTCGIGGACSNCPPSLQPVAVADDKVFVGSVALMDALLATVAAHMWTPESEPPEGIEPYIWCACGWRSDQAGFTDTPAASLHVHLSNELHAASVKALQPLVVKVGPAEFATIRADAERDALLRAADAIQALHPGEVKNSVTFLRERAGRVE